VPRRFADYDPVLLARAVKMARLPGVTHKRAAARYGLSTGVLRRAMKEQSDVGYDPTELVLHAITDAGTRIEGELHDLESLASYCDYVNKDGCTVDEVQRRIDTLVARGMLAIEDGRWSLLVAFP
jgi:hypothetical protein